MSTSSLPSSASQSIRPSDSQEKQMKIMVKWLSLFKFSWLRKCKVCRVRGTKCLCKRPSLALEHIFFLEERKNKFGARNFSHVSDTMVTTTSSTVMSANNTVLMRGSSFGDEYAFADYYYNPSQGNSMTQQSQTQQQQRQSLTSSHSSRGSLDKKKKKRASPTSNSTTAIVRKNSGKMVPTNTRRRFEELPNEYMLYSEARSGASACVATSSSSLTGSSRRRPLRLQSGSSSSSSSAARKEENGVSFKFYGRGGKSSSLATTPSTFNSSRGLGSKNDSLILSASSSSALRISTSSDRMSVDNNFGSYNPRGMFIDNGYASSIQEDDDDDALQQLNGWLQASPSSTAGSFAAPRNIHCF